MLAEHAQTSQHDSCWSAIGPMRDLRAGSRITATRNTIRSLVDADQSGALMNSVSLDFDPHIGSGAVLRVDSRWRVWRSGLQTREKELQKAVTDEQTRWTNFNDRLDALERSLPASISH
jgi:hypothetical protein